MAAQYGQSVSRASVGRGNGLELLLPNGPCNAKETYDGPHTSICGCRRFWLKEPVSGSHQASERAWCFCGHHACFHDNMRTDGTGYNASEQGQIVDVNAPARSQHFAIPSNERNGFVAPTWSELLRGASADARPEHATPTAPPRPTTGLGINGGSQPQSINTRLWDALNGFARQQVDGTAAGPSSRLPSTAPLPSTGAPSIADERRASPSRDLQDRISRFRSMGPPVTIPHAEMMANVAGPYSATEVATEVGTPSVQGTPDLRRHSPRNAAQATLFRQRITGPPSEASQPRRPTARPISAGPSLSIQEMCNTIQNFGQRIAQLESVSFDNIPSNEVRQRFEMQDGRLLDLEHWRSDQEQAQQNDDTQQKLSSFEERLVELESWREHDHIDEDGPRGLPDHRKRSLLPSSGSFESDGSFDLSAAQQTEAVVLATIAANAETRPRIDALESRISELESTSLPTFAKPWTIQVVLLPFGRQLPGIWFSSMESTQHSTQSVSHPSQEWSAQHADPKLSSRSAATSGTAWTTESIEVWAKEAHDEWLSPKACGPSGTVFQRLASRGLVREVEVQAPDARHIFNVISSVFGDILGTDETSGVNQSREYRALQEKYIPLRKVRKSSRLRFLSQAEMVTPATWSASFLESSVFMKANGERRLYLTTPEGYLQPSRPSWSWQGLRHLPLYDGDGALQAAEALGKVIDACWSFTPRLDHVSSPQSSYASGDSPWSESVFKDFADMDAEAEVDLGSPVARIHHHQRRSVSLPSSTSAHRMEIETAPKRRVTSFDLDLAGNVQPTTETSTKRRRISTSPEWERRGFGITPRYSPPQASVEISQLRSSQGASSRGRATTPFAMPTPRSHNDSRADDNGLEIDGDYPMSHSDGADHEEEWEGMQDGPAILPVVPEHFRHKGIIDEDGDQDDLESLDAGETIYEVFDEI
ncbi:hypothetical protein Slin15195_G095940 [Septoria linicola]|uniref:Uncharacterized protein n=1 Tax=Septoria linicola TaxID=215465 RepID=A0A9Q9B152_9PEZI|nr:hypothetical protein Slin14017_G059030 [Septoria linicola]USW56275.1 hypothetical protein Slin15195_G095940 [Septoria linicola]